MISQHTADVSVINMCISRNLHRSLSLSYSNHLNSHSRIDMIVPIHHGHPPTEGEV